MIDYCILGSGISGSTIANLLSKSSSVEIIDKARGIGGRCSSKKFTKNLNFDHGLQYFSSKNYKRDPNDISHLIEEVNSEYFENMCQSLSGHFVPTSLRQFIWTYRLLQKNKSMPSSTNAPLLSKELYRLVPQKFSRTIYLHIFLNYQIFLWLVVFM